MSALKHQEGGNHYAKLKIQPIEYIHANGLGFAEGNVIKYVTRWRDKNGIADLKKARHFIDLLIELEQKQHTIRVTELKETSKGASLQSVIDKWNEDKELPSSGIYGDAGYTEQDMQAASLVHDAEPGLGSCDNCGKRQADGWALMCVSCADKALNNENKQTKCSAETCEKEAKPAQAQADSETRQGNNALDPELVSLCSKTEIHADKDGWIAHIGNECPLSDGNTVVSIKGENWQDSMGARANQYDLEIPVGNIWRITHWGINNL